MVLTKTLLAAGFTVAAAAKSAVLDLIPSNFDDVVLNSGKPTLVEFFAPWCGHCKKLAPVYEELAASLQFAKNKVQIAKVDADAEKDLSKRFGVSGFPSIKWFNGKSKDPVDYDSGRDLDSLQDFITEQTGIMPRKLVVKPSHVVMLDNESFKKTIGGGKNVIVAFTAPWCGHCKNLAPVWEKLAENFANEPNVVIAKVDVEAESSSKISAEYEIKSYPTIKFFPAGDATAVMDYEGGRSEDAFVNYLNEKAGTHRMVGGGLDATAGTFAALDTVVAKLTGGASLAEVAEEAKREAEKLKEEAQYKYAQYYLRVLDKLAKSDGYAAQEFARLDSILKKGELVPAKVDELTRKRNVLSRFLERVKDEL